MESIIEKHKYETGLSKESRTALNMAGTRVTNQRALILGILQKQGHLDADEIYRQARRKQPRLSLSTVYRNLRTLKGLGLVEELHFDDSHHHYEAKPSTEHHHLACLGCGKVIEFHYPLSRHIKKGVAAAKDFEIVDADIHIAGYCSNCRRGRK